MNQRLRPILTHKISQGEAFVVSLWSWSDLAVYLTSFAFTSIAMWRAGRYAQQTDLIQRECHYLEHEIKRQGMTVPVDRGMSPFFERTTF